MGEDAVRKWFIRYRVIAPSDYHTPHCYIPTEQTYVEAETADEAWEKWVTAPGAAPRDWYIRVDIEEDKK